MKLLSKAYPLESILLDPNNYRFMDLKDWEFVPDDRFHEPLVQDRAMNALRTNTEFAVSLLKDSILKNGFVPLEQIVVRPYQGKQDRCVVVEGNRRIAALKWIRDNEEGGALRIDPDLRGRLSSMNVMLLDPDDPENEIAIETLMAIRHVSGIKQWGAFQQARLIVELMELPNSTYTTVAERLGMSSREVARRYRASMALRQMEKDPEFGSYATREMHGLFQETFASTAVRDWLMWDESRKEYTNRENLEYFYSWISESDEMKPKILSVYDVRKLRSIVRSEQALSILKSDDGTLMDAAARAEETGTGSRLSGTFETAIRNASSVIESLPVGVLRSLSQDQLNLLEDLRSQIEEALKNHQLLQS